MLSLAWKIQWNFGYVKLFLIKNISIIFIKWQFLETNISFGIFFWWNFKNRFFLFCSTFRRYDLWILLWSSFLSIFLLLLDHSENPFNSLIYFLHRKSVIFKQNFQNSIIINTALGEWYISVCLKVRLFGINEFSGKWFLDLPVFKIVSL